MHMAIQPQLPILLADHGKLTGAVSAEQMCSGVSLVADNLLQLCPTAFHAASLLNVAEEGPGNSTLKENRKLGWQEEATIVAACQQQSCLNMSMATADLEMVGKYPSNSLSMALSWPNNNYAAIFPFENISAPLGSTPSPTSENLSFLSDSSCVTSRSFHLHSQLLKQEQEIHQIFKLYEEHMNQALQEQRERHTNALLAMVDQCMSRCVREKEAEIEKLHSRNMELENLVKQISFESQIWQNVARNNEAMAASLRSNLEQLVVQWREQVKEGSGESEAEAEDMESCLYRGTGEDTEERNIEEEQRRCRYCKSTKGVCILLLPCKHLCVCEGCDNKYNECPLCGQPKSASVKVYLE